MHVGSSGARSTVDLVEASPPRRLAPTAALIDVFVYVVVLNVFVQLSPSVIAESFLMTVLTAVLLKAALELVVAVKAPLKHRLESAQSVWGRAAAAVGVWLVLVVSKFVVIEAVALLFGDRVSLGGFWSVTALVIALVVSRTLVRAWLSGRTGDEER